MAKKKTAASGIGVLVIVVVIVGMKLLGGPDLTSLLTGNSNQQSSNQSASRVDAPKPTSPTRTSQGQSGSASNSGGSATAYDSEDERVEQLFRDGASDEILTLSGVVTKSLPDDNEGSRHQKFILKLSSGRTILVAHNIDLAEKVPLREGDRITLRGEYEWSQQGGVVHWTHHDPKQWREGGWIEHNGVRYE